MRVSVCLPVWNGEATLARALDSVFQQTSCDYEVLVFNDGSTDGSSKIAKSYDVRLFESGNVGVGAARNKLLAEAKGELVAWIDADDAWLPDKLDRQLHAISDSDAVLVHSDCWYVHQDGSTQERNLSFNPASLAYDHILPDNRIVTSSVLVRRDALLGSGGFSTTKRCSDWYAWLMLAKEGRFLHLPERQVLYFVHGSSLANAGFLFHQDQYHLLADMILPRSDELFGALSTAQRARYTRMIVRDVGIALSSMAKHKELLGERREARQLHKQALRTAPDVLRVWIRAIRTLLQPAGHI